MNNYSKYRGKCKEYVDNAIEKDSTLTAVRGHYCCPFWGMQAHWWCIRQDGTIFDPTIEQFPKPHIGDYIPFDGTFDCSQCGKRILEEQAVLNGNYAFCSTACAMRFVGL